jgi:predicted phosphohydrolase
MDVFGGSWVHFESRLKEYWEYMVSEKDTVVIPGDISWGMNLSDAEPDFEFIHKLPGRKILMKGNHDYWWNSITKLRAFCEEKGFDSIEFLHNDAIFAEGKVLCGSRGWMCEDKMTEQDQKVLRRESLRFRISLEKATKLADAKEAETGTRPELICFSHYPVVTAAQRENPILDVLKQYGVKECYYGHLHGAGASNLAVQGEVDGITFRLVAADYLDFTPLKIRE